MTSVWSAADAAANGMTLSNGGLTAKGVTSGGAAPPTIRGTIGKTTGKLYVEFLCVQTNSSDYVFFGLASAGFPVSNVLGTLNYSAGVAWNLTHASAGFTSNYVTTQYPSIAEVWAIAVDFAAGSVWLAQNNVWVNGSNPATGSLPIVSFVPATVGDLFPGMSLFVNETWTLQPTAATQKYAAPAGFSAWDPPPVGNYVDFSGNIGGASLYGKLLYGQKLYSRDPAFAPIFASDFDIVGTAPFAGDLAPVVTFSADLSLTGGTLAGDIAPVVTFSADLTTSQGANFGGDLKPLVTFSADLTLVVALSGDFAPQVNLGAALSLDLAFEAALEGAFDFTVEFAASDLISHPLWEGPELCDPVDWEESELCNG